MSTMTRIGWILLFGIVAGAALGYLRDAPMLRQGVTSRAGPCTPADIGRSGCRPGSALALLVQRLR